MAFKLIGPRLRKWLWGKRLVPDYDAGYPDASGNHNYVWRDAHNANLEAIPAANACINILADAMAQLPVTVGVLEDPVDDFWMPMEDHPISELLRNPAPSLMDPWQFWEWLYRGLHAQGQSFCYIQRGQRDAMNPRGRPVELVPASLFEAPKFRGRRGREYMLNLMGREKGRGSTAAEPMRVSDADVIALHGPGFDGLTSPSPVQYAASLTLQGMDAGMREQLRNLNEANIRNAVQASAELAELDADVLNGLEDRVRKNMDDARNQGKWLVLSPGFTLASSEGISAVDSQLVQWLGWGVENVARCWRMSPTRLGHYHEGFRSTKYEFQATDFEVYTLRGHCQRTAAQFGAKLLTMEDTMAGRVMRMPSDRARRGSFSEESEAAGRLASTDALITPNEGRRRLRYKPIDDGDTLRQPKGAPPQDTGGEPMEGDE